MKTALSTDAFLALAAVGWSDGTLDGDEAEAIMRAAEEAELGEQDMRRVERAVREKQDLASLDLTSMAPRDRVFVYATAVWLARLDGVVEPGERQALWELGDRLQLPDGIRTKASAAAFEVSQLASGDRPGKYDFVALEAEITRRLGA